MKKLLGILAKLLKNANDIKFMGIEVQDVNPKCTVINVRFHILK